MRNYRKTILAGLVTVFAVIWLAVSGERVTAANFDVALVLLVVVMMGLETWRNRYRRLRARQLECSWCGRLDATVDGGCPGCGARWVGLPVDPRPAGSGPLRAGVRVIRVDPEGGGR